MEIKFKYFFLFILLLIINSCSSQSSDNLKKIYSLYKDQDKNKKILQISSSMINHIEFPIIEVTSNKIVKQVLMVQISERDNLINYISGSGQGVTMNGAYVTKTIGFNANLISLELKDNNLSKNTLLSEHDNVYQKEYKFVNPLFEEDTYKLNCIKLNLGLNDVSIMENILSLYKIEEKCKSSTWNFNNYYWVNKDGLVLKSTQTISPKNFSIEITILKE